MGQTITAYIQEKGIQTPPLNKRVSKTLRSSLQMDPLAFIVTHSVRTGVKLQNGFMRMTRINVTDVWASCRPSL